MSVDQYSVASDEQEYRRKHRRSDRRLTHFKRMERGEYRNTSQNDCSTVQLHITCYSTV